MIEMNSFKDVNDKISNRFESCDLWKQAEKTDFRLDDYDVPLAKEWNSSKSKLEDQQKEYDVETAKSSSLTSLLEENKEKREIKLPRHIPTINEGMVGQKYPNTDIEYRKHTFMLDGEKIEGVFPVFNSKFDALLPKELRNASDTEQFKYCTQQLVKKIEDDPEMAKQFTCRQLEQIKNGEPRISGLTWHHNEIPGKMQLVDATEHNFCRHTGGRSIWGGGSDCR